MKVTNQENLVDHILQYYPHLAVLIFLLKGFIIKFVFDPSFMPMQELFLFQLVADVLRVMSLIIANLMIAKAMSKLFIVSELLFSFTGVVLHVYSIYYFG